MKLIWVALVVAIVIIWMLNRQSKPSWTVFGTMNCGWTRRQIDELKKNGVHYKFMDCAKGECEGHNVEGLPTNILPDGTRKVGFTSVG